MKNRENRESRPQERYTAVHPKYSLWLHNIPGMTNSKICHVLEQAGSSEALYGWSEERLLQETTLRIEDIHAITASRTGWNPEAEWMRLMEMGISYVSMEQREYPAQLRNIHNPPFGLYYKGRLPGDNGSSGCGAMAVRSESGGEQAGAGAVAKEQAGAGAVAEGQTEAGAVAKEQAGADAVAEEQFVKYEGKNFGQTEIAGMTAGVSIMETAGMTAGVSIMETAGMTAGVPITETAVSSVRTKSVAIVGARSRSEYGLQIARKLGETLGQNGIAVISGLARGIDADAHIGALDGGGRTYAVLGCGVDICYPRSNRYLYDRILEQGGGILSEYPPGQTPLAALFPQRNRIISGLSDCVVVVEARKKSGSLITADIAMEQGRDVYAVPGRVGEALSEGTNRLIHQGAGIYTGPEEFLSDINLSGNFTLDLNFSKKMLEKEESLVYSVLDLSPTGLGAILQKTSIPLEHLLEILASLVEKGYIWESVPNYYVRKL